MGRNSAGRFALHNLNLETLTRLCIAKMLIRSMDLILEERTTSRKISAVRIPLGRNVEDLDTITGASRRFG